MGSFGVAPRRLTWTHEPDDDVVVVDPLHHLPQILGADVARDHPGGLGVVPADPVRGLGEDEADVLRVGEVLPGAGVGVRVEGVADLDGGHLALEVGDDHEAAGGVPGEVAVPLAHEQLHLGVRVGGGDDPPPDAGVLLGVGASLLGGVQRRAEHGGQHRPGAHPELVDGLRDDGRRQGRQLGGFFLGEVGHDPVPVVPIPHLDHLVEDRAVPLLAQLDGGVDLLPRVLHGHPRKNGLAPEVGTSRPELVGFQGRP